MNKISSQQIQQAISDCTPSTATGKLLAARGTTALAQIPVAAIGDICQIKRRDGSVVHAEIVSFHDNTIHLAPFDTLQGIYPGSTVTNTHQKASIEISKDFDFCNKVLNASGSPLNGRRGTEAEDSFQLPIHKKPPCPLRRKVICEQFVTGVPLIDSLFPIGYGQRIALIAGPGVGKSTLLGSLACSANIDVCIVGLVGERGREVREFIEDCLGEEGMKKTALVVSTSDESSAQRKMAAQTATALAEYYRSKGKRVLLLIDSLTRTARAIREIGLSAGEPPVRHGYTASVFTELPSLLERTGMGEHGSITAIYTILSSHEHDTDPLTEEIKSLLDGHLVLSSQYATRGYYPAIDPLQSISRLSGKLQSQTDRGLAIAIKNVFHRLVRDRDIVLLGGQADDELQACINIEVELNSMLRTPCTPEEQTGRRQKITQLLATNGLMNKETDRPPNKASA